MAGVQSWRTASTRIAATAARSMTRGRLVAPPRRKPGGKLHAYRPGEAHTACGELLAPLRRWPARRFGRGGLARNRCETCVDEVRRSTAGR